jgi:hypothetical protein
MSETLQELADIPREFFKDGTQFINRCTKRKSTSTPSRPSSAASTSNNQRSPTCISTATDSTSSRSKGVHQDLTSCWNGLFDHGRNRLFHQAKYALRHVCWWGRTTDDCSTYTGQQCISRIANTLRQSVDSARGAVYSKLEKEASSWC